MCGSFQHRRLLIKHGPAALYAQIPFTLQTNLNIGVGRVKRARGTSHNAEIRQCWAQALLSQTGRRLSACTASQSSRWRSCRARWAALQPLCSQHYLMKQQHGPIEKETWRPLFQILLACQQGYVWDLFLLPAEQSCLQYLLAALLCACAQSPLRKCSAAPSSMWVIYSHAVAVICMPIT